MYDIQDPNPEHGFDKYEALRQLDGAERTSYERFLTVNEAVESCLEIIDRFAPVVVEERPKPPVGIDSSNVVSMEEYRERRGMRQDARSTINMQPESAISMNPENNPVIGTVDPYANHIEGIMNRVDQIREQQMREAA